jgi:uncharacterized protein (DUF2147 family)
MDTNKMDGCYYAKMNLLEGEKLSIKGK